MAVFVIPTFTDPYYVEEVDLDRVAFRLEFRYNSRDESWYVSFYDVNDVLLRASVRVVEDWPLLRNWRATNRPAGEIFALTTGNISRPPQRLELDTEYDFVYIGEA